MHCTHYKVTHHIECGYLVTMLAWILWSVVLMMCLQLFHSIAVRILNQFLFFFSLRSIKFTSLGHDKSSFRNQYFEPMPYSFIYDECRLNVACIYFLNFFYLLTEIYYNKMKWYTYNNYNDKSQEKNKSTFVIRKRERERVKKVLQSKLRN